MHCFDSNASKEAVLRLAFFEVFVKALAMALSNGRLFVASRL